MRVWTGLSIRPPPSLSNLLASPAAFPTPSPLRPVLALPSCGVGLEAGLCCTCLGE